MRWAGLPTGVPGRASPGRAVAAVGQNSSSSVRSVVHCRLHYTTLYWAGQVYAPLAGSPHHRTLYLFACLLPPCWGQPAAWVALR